MHTTPSTETRARVLVGHHALVCGASAGIGRAIAQALAAQGCGLTILARRAERLASLSPELYAAGAPFVAICPADLDDGPALERALDGVRGELPPIDIVIHNAGGPPGGPLLDASEADLLAAFGRHVLSAQRLAKRFVPGMAAGGFGRIVNIVSTSVYEPIPGLGVSNTIRAAMAGWSKSLARELPPGVTINNVLPGFTETERLEALAGARASREGRSPEAVRAAWIGEVPEGRLIRPEETAAAVVFLCSPLGGAVRGVSLAVDGGRLRGI